jgi:hypothetical protein
LIVKRCICLPGHFSTDNSHLQDELGNFRYELNYNCLCGCGLLTQIRNTVFSVGIPTSQMTFPMDCEL